MDVKGIEGVADDGDTRLGHQSLPPIVAGHGKTKGVTKMFGSLCIISQVDAAYHMSCGTELHRSGKLVVEKVVLNDAD